MLLFSRKCSECSPRTEFPFMTMLTYDSGSPAFMVAFDASVDTSQWRAARDQCTFIKPGK